MLCATALGMVSVFWTLQRIAAFSPLAAGLAAAVMLAAVVKRFFATERGVGPLRVGSALPGTVRKTILEFDRSPNNGA